MYRQGAMDWLVIVGILAALVLLFLLFSTGVPLLKNLVEAVIQA